MFWKLNFSSCCFSLNFWQIPESPNWLLSRDRPKDAVMSLQWLRGCVSAEYVNEEFTKLRNHSVVANTCGPCTKQLIECPHPRPTFFEKLKELKRKRTLKPFILTLFLNFFLEFSLCVIWRSYIIQVLKAFGMPFDNIGYLATILSFVNIAGSCCFLFSVKMVGKRRLYLISTIAVVLCSIGLSKQLNKLIHKNLKSFNSFPFFSSSLLWQVHLVSSSFHRIGPHFKIPPIQQFQISIWFAKLSAITGTWHWFWWL